MTGKADEAARAFRDELRRDPARNLDAIRRGVEENRLCMPDGRSVVRHATPWFMSAERDADTKRAASLVMNALLRVAECVPDHPGVRACLALPFFVELAFYFEKRPRPRLILGRPDGLFENGVIRVIEHNPYPGGMAHVGGVDEIFARMPAMLRLRERVPVRGALRGKHLVDSFARDRGPGRGNVRLGAIVPVGRDGQMVPDSSQSIPYFSAASGIAAVRGTAQMVELCRGKLFVADEPITHVLIEDWGFLKTHGLGHPVVRAVQSRAVEVLNGIVGSAVTGAKTAFAVLSDPRFRELFSHDEARAIERHVPWTRTLRDERTTYRGKPIDLLRFVEEHRTRLVLKPSLGRSGSNLTLGWEVDDPTWRRAMARLVKEGGVAQERVQVDTVELLRFEGDDLVEVSEALDHCPFVWAGCEVHGAMARSMGGSMFHVGGGGALVSVFAVA